MVEVLLLSYSLYSDATVPVCLNTVIYICISHRIHFHCRTGHFKYILLVIAVEYLLIVPALDGYVRVRVVFSMWSENFSKTLCGNILT